MPPIAKRIPRTYRAHGDVRVDDYAWLRNREGDPDVLRYLRAENRYTDAMLAHTKSLQRRLVREFRTHMQETDRSVPVRDGAYWYVRALTRGSQYPVYSRRKGGLRAPEEIVLDVNALARGRKFCDVRAVEVSPDHAQLAYTVDFAGNEEFTLVVRDLATGDERVERERVGEDIVWANDNRTIFCTELDATRRPYRTVRHVVGTSASVDTLVYEERDAKFWTSIHHMRSRRFLCIVLSSKETMETRVVDLDRPTTWSRAIIPRRSGHRYSVTHAGDQWYIRTNDRAEDFRIVRAPLDRPSVWTPVVPHRPGVRIVGIYGFRKHLVVMTMRDGIEAFAVHDLARGTTRRIALPSGVCDLDAPSEWNPNFDTTAFRFEYSTPVVPCTVYDAELATGVLVERKRQCVRAYDPNRYATTRMWARARDGERIPIDLVHRKGLRWNGRTPVRLDGYGAYGIAMSASFSSLRVSLLERGVVIAIARVRGGSDRGERWYQHGKFLQKRNTFTDFIACAEYLIRMKVTRPDRLVISGGSAGGLLIGAVVNMWPELFAGAIADVPFVDTLTTMSDPTIPLTTLEYEEWGNPKDERYYRAMRAYSPYDNVQPQPYPAMLVLAGLNDPRVAYWEPAKWVAKLRRIGTGDRPLLLRTQMSSGHQGASGRYDALAEYAEDYAFTLTTLGITK